MYIKVRVTPGARHEAVEKVSDVQFKISVREPREQNRANSRVIELIAQAFRVPASSVRILNGHRAPSKLLSVDV